MMVRRLPRWRSAVRVAGGSRPPARTMIAITPMSLQPMTDRAACSRSLRDPYVGECVCPRVSTPPSAGSKRPKVWTVPPTCSARPSPGPASLAAGRASRSPTPCTADPTAIPSTPWSWPSRSAPGLWRSAWTCWPPSGWCTGPARSARRTWRWQAGSAGAAAAIATGLADWLSLNGRDKRVGLVHGTVNITTLALNLWSGRCAGRSAARPACWSAPSPMRP